MSELKAPPQSFPFLTASKWLIPLSLITVILNICPLAWHIRSRNISSASLIGWTLILNFMTFVNAIIWHDDNFFEWWHGQVLCDIEVRIMIGAAFGGLAGAALCLLQSLARVLNTDKQKSVAVRKQWVRDILLCWGVPALTMLLYYVVQNARYVVVAAYGCAHPAERTWVTILVMFLVPTLLTLIASYYAALVIFRLNKYRSQVSALLERNNTTRARFIRLFILASLLSITMLPISLAQMIIFINDGPMESYSWKKVHSAWDTIPMVPSSNIGASQLPERWYCIALGFCTFFTLGMGDEVKKMYREGCDRVGLSKLSSSLGSSLGSVSSVIKSGTWLSSASSRAKLMLERGSGLFSRRSDTMDSWSPDSSRFSKLSSFSKPAGVLLPLSEPKIAVDIGQKTSGSGWSLFGRMPTFGQAMAGVSPTPIYTGRARTGSAATDSAIPLRKPKKAAAVNANDASSTIFITLPSPTIGGITDDMVLQMVGAEAFVKDKKPTDRAQGLGEVAR